MTARPRLRIPLLPRGELLTVAVLAATCPTPAAAALTVAAAVATVATLDWFDRRRSEPAADTPGAAL
jgi:hypothetical protein